MFFKTNAKYKQGLTLGVAMIMIFLSRFFIEYLKNVQVDSEEVLRQNTGLILGQWLSIPFVLWGVWLVWNALKKSKQKEEVAIKTNKDQSNFITK